MSVSETRAVCDAIRAPGERSRASTRRSASHPRWKPGSRITSGASTKSWHHDQSDEGGAAKNFGVIFSLWDFLFGTAHWPRDRDPVRLGYPGDGEMPMSLAGQLTWPLVHNRRVPDQR